MNPFSMPFGPLSCGGGLSERTGDALGNRSSKLQLLLSVALALSGVSAYHVQEFTSSGKERSACITLAGKAGAGCGKEPESCTEPAGTAGVGVQRNSNGRRERVGDPQPRSAPGCSFVCHRGQSLVIWRSACSAKASTEGRGAAAHERYDKRGAGAISGISATDDRFRGAGQAQQCRGSFAGDRRASKGTPGRRRGSPPADRRKSLRKSRFTAAHQGRSGIQPRVAGRRGASESGKHRSTSDRLESGDIGRGRGRWGSHQRMAEDSAGSAAISCRGGADWVLRRPSAAGQSAYSVGCSHVDSWHVARVPEDMSSRR